MSRLTLATLMIALLFPSAGLFAAEGKGDPIVRPDLPVISHARAANIAPDLNDTVAENGRWVWRHTLRHEGAAFVKAHFVRFNLRKGDVLILRSASGKVVEELTARGPKNRGSFWGLSAFGNTLDLELRVRDTRHYLRETPFVIDYVTLGDPAMLEAVTGTPLHGPDTAAVWTKDVLTFQTKSICTPADFEDVMCYQGDPGKWASIFASVGVMTFGSNPSTGGLWCSGSNVSPNNFLLTNDHCITGTVGADCSNDEFVFKYYNTNCGSGPTNGDWQSFRCDTTVAGSPFVSCEATPTTLDFSLHTVMGDPASTFGFVTPDPVPITDGEAIYIVQHPSGRPHEIAHGSGANVDADGNNLRYYDTLDTEGGSSGSPIFRDADDKLIGLHHCGGCTTPGTGNRGMLMSDIYPHIQEFLCSNEISLSGAPATGLAEVAGNGDGVIDPGETWQFTPVLRNSACATQAETVTADIAVNAGSGGDVVLLDTFGSFGPIAAGATAPSTAPIRFQLGENAECAGDVIFDVVNIAAATGGPFADLTNYFSAEIGEVPVSTDMFQDFAGGMPAGWTIVDNGTGTGPAQTWTSADPGGRGLMAAPYMIVDSDNHGTGLAMDEELITDAFSVANSPSVELQFEHNFRWWSGGMDEQADVEIRSTATGGAWVNVANFSGGDSVGIMTYDITAQAAGQNDVQLRFHYYDAEYEWYWAIDDIYVRGNAGRVCTPFGLLFADDFEGGDLSLWSSTVP